VEENRLDAELESPNFATKLNFADYGKSED
jgi:hypothetical protein